MDIDNITYDDTKLEDLNFFWTKSGVPCFMADRDNIEEIIENLGFNIYYMICNTAVDRKIETKSVGYNAAPTATTTTWVTDLSTNIVKVVNNFVGRSVAIVKDEDLYDFDVTRETAEYNLPPIPHDIVVKLDEFFRLVDAQHGTESIVLLTFDPQYEGTPEGWGVLVPDQTNTSVHCKYDAESIVDQKPENVMIVGSVHSHPNMAAYASGTDHADQADFDGIHITYGWQKSVNGGATQYHIEMQIGGTAWTLKPEDVFEDFVFTKAPDPQVIEWSQKVKKVHPPTGGTHKPASTPQQSIHHQTTTTQVAAYTLPGDTTSRFRPIGDPNFQEYPNEIFDSAAKSGDALFIVELNYADRDLYCYACANIISDDDLFDQVCPICDIMFCNVLDGISSILSGAGEYLRKRSRHSNVDFYLWSMDEKGKETFSKIASKAFDTDEKEAPLSLIKDIEEEYPISDNLDEYYYSGYTANKTVCCDIPIADVALCKCETTVLYDDILDFDVAHPYDVYSRNDSCIHCSYYYSRECKPYQESIIEFVRTKRPMESSIQPCSDWVEHSDNTYLEGRYLYD
jgi:hypothetical protein